MGWLCRSTSYPRRRPLIQLTLKCGRGACQRCLGAWGVAGQAWVARKILCGCFRRPCGCISAGNRACLRCLPIPSPPRLLFSVYSCAPALQHAVRNPQTEVFLSMLGLPWNLDDVAPAGPPGGWAEAQAPGGPAGGWAPAGSDVASVGEGACAQGEARSFPVRWHSLQSWLGMRAGQAYIQHQQGDQSPAAPAPLPPFSHPLPLLF